MFAAILNCIAEVVAGSAAWLGRGLSCVCVQRRDSDASNSFDLTLAQEECLQRLQRRIDVPYDSSIIEHQVPLILLLFKSVSNCGNHYDVHFNLCTQFYLLSLAYCCT
ncbi:uncharacterized protein LOC124842697 isoform X2 [Vigna umbellata]|uniref:uncharacterized protein LOC124842697 isoform X2 n=1 Tax=Vigna umbellata TaxID=87088 RepID=UPI001F5EBF78|nr:uncharacterized protein LOC124842697 isoform X2 [Vigna umbellata]